MSVVTINVSTGYIEVTKAELDSLIVTNGLIKSKFYHITDRGIFLQALETNVISSTGERVMLIVKNEYYTAGTGILGVWNANVTPDTNDIAVWGGKVWKSLTGAVGAPIDDTALDAEWELIPTTNDTYYFTKSFGCTYDITNDWVASQWDDRGNVFTLSWILGVNFGYAISPNDFSDWGNEQIFDNTCYGIYNNSNADFIALNSNSGRITNNSNSEAISYNSNVGEIAFNSNSGIISNNSNSEAISYNSNVGEIAFNSNSGIISNNSNTGRITTNSNTGRITNNSNVGEIYNNSNVGEIYNNSNTGIISNNSNSGGIYNNSNSGIITNNSNTGRISNNSNTGRIEGITSDTTDIEYNTNNGDIVTTVVGVITDSIVNK